MGERIHVLAQQLFGKHSVADCDLQEIRSLVQRYPYFAPAQFLLLEKLKLEGSPDYEGQLQKAVLYYHNPLEFQYFISSDKFYTDISFVTPARSAESGMPSAETTAAAAEPDLSPAETAEASEPIVPVAPIEVAAPVTVPEETSASEPQPVESFGTIRNLPSEPSEDPVSHEEEEAHPGPALVEPDLALPEMPLLSDAGGAELQAAAAQPAEVAPEPVASVGEAPREAEASTEDVREEKPASNAKGSYVLPTPPRIQENGQMQAPSEPLAFEPYHTVDYFASQGIKLNAEEQSKDKFGKQLKSFTEWLKTMKRLPAREQTASVDAQAEKNVAHLAEDSVHEADVVTEAMAEVWIKQGNRQKALEVYNKLSLLNPSKKAYFAAKIEQLNRS